MRKSAAGYLVIVLMMVAALVGVVLLATLGRFQTVGQQQVSSNATVFAGQIRSYLMQLIQNNQAWQNTVNDAQNTSLTCLRNATSCAGAGGSFRLWNAATVPAVYYDPAGASNGFGPTGAPCTTFDSLKGNDACPFHFSLSWTAICPLPGCSPPQVQISGALSYAPASARFPINPTGFSLGFIRGSGGPGGAAGCPPGQVVAGYDPYPNPICVPAGAASSGPPVASGTYCGTSFGGQVGVSCQGHDPASSCPPGFSSLVVLGWSSVGGINYNFYTCTSP